MAAPPQLVKAVEAAIVASAHLSAYEHVAAATHALRRLGTLSSGRWRAAARELEGLEEDLQSAFSDVARQLSGHADELGIDEEALWAAGDAAATLDLLRERALDEVEDNEAAVQLLNGRALLGVAFVEDEDASDRGTTLVFGWGEPLAPATWAWQASWITTTDEETQLELAETGQLEAGEALLESFAAELGQDPTAALRAAAEALTRASLLASLGGDEDEDESNNGR